MRRDRILLMVLITAVLGALLVGGRWLARAPAEASGVERRSSSSVEVERSPGRAEPLASHRADARPTSERAASESRVRAAEFDRAKRDALRAEILRARSPRSAATPSAAQVSPPGTLQDRIGGREALAQFLNHDFMPLADECIEQARARTPALEGMVAIGLDTLADVELGGIVDAVEIQPDNEVDDPELLECLSQTALSMIMPPPPESGREQFVITIPIAPDSD
jgi:hypothetical protein